MFPVTHLLITLGQLIAVDNFPDYYTDYSFSCRKGRLS
jgi:hypothetical protein